MSLYCCFVVFCVSCFVCIVLTMLVCVNSPLFQNMTDQLNRCEKCDNAPCICRTTSSSSSSDLQCDRCGSSPPSDYFDGAVLPPLPPNGTPIKPPATDEDKASWSESKRKRMARADANMYGKRWLVRCCLFNAKSGAPTKPAAYAYYWFEDKYYKRFIADKSCDQTVINWSSNDPVVIDGIIEGLDVCDVRDSPSYGSIIQGYMDADENRALKAKAAKLEKRVKELEKAERARGSDDDDESVPESVVYKTMLKEAKAEYKEAEKKAHVKYKCVECKFHYRYRNLCTVCTLDYRVSPTTGTCLDCCNDVDHEHGPCGDDSATETDGESDSDDDESDPPRRDNRDGKKKKVVKQWVCKCGFDVHRCETSDKCARCCPCDDCAFNRDEEATNTKPVQKTTSGKKPRIVAGKGPPKTKPATGGIKYECRECGHVDSDPYHWCEKPVVDNEDDDFIGPLCKVCCTNAYHDHELSCVHRSMATPGPDGVYRCGTCAESWIRNRESAKKVLPLIVSRKTKPATGGIKKTGGVTVPCRDCGDYVRASDNDAWCKKPFYDSEDDEEDDAAGLCIKCCVDVTHDHDDEDNTCDFCERVFDTITCDDCNGCKACCKMYHETMVRSNKHNELRDEANRLGRESKIAAIEARNARVALNERKDLIASVKASVATTSSSKGKCDHPSYTDISGVV
jgi:hypothetical protein